MQKISLLFSFMVSCLLANAQVQNPSFEVTDSTGKIASWKLTQGKSTQLTSAQFGVIPFTAYHGNFFVLLESDTQTATIKKGILEQTFAFADTPGSFTLPYFYIPESISQHGQVELFMSKWNGSSRDTILYVKDTIVAVADSNRIRIQWNPFAKTLQGLYRQAVLPDTATIRFTNDDGAVAGKNIRLYLDAVQFGRWAVGTTEIALADFQVYPNPANENIFITGNLPLADCVLIGLDGKQYTVTALVTNGGMNLDVSTVPAGFYVLKISAGGNILTKRIIIAHEH